MDETFRLLTGRRTLVWAIATLLTAAGCDSLGTTKKFSNPVMPPPPRQRLLGKNGENAESSTRMLTDAAATGDSDGTDLADDGAPIGQASLKGGPEPEGGGRAGRGIAPLRTASATNDPTGRRLAGKGAALPGATGARDNSDETLDDSDDDSNEVQSTGRKDG